MKNLLLILFGFVLGGLAVGYYLIAYPPRLATSSAAAETVVVPEPVASAPPPEAVPSTAIPAAETTQTPPQLPAAQTMPPAPAATAPLPATTSTGDILLPVQGVTREQLLDTFTDARSQGRSHDAIDIMAPAGTPVLAVADGHIEKLFTSERGGLTIYQFEPSGRLAYYYAHLQSYADGIAEGQQVRRGQVIGYVGSTGNANPAAPHLHFAIFLLGPERNWWQGQAINPYPILMGRSTP
ncbi:MAG: M23 family metallopeptidase [Pseudoxanthomonas sp.]